MITKILMTLPGNFRHFISAWESAPAGERTLDNLKARLVTEESRITVKADKSGNALTSNAQRGKFRRGRGGKSKGAGMSNNTSKPGKCYVCGEAGHWARECAQRKGDDDAGGSSANQASEKKPRDEGLVSVALQSAPSQTMSHAGWVMDSGASDHMCCQRDWFITYEAFDHPVPVCIGDGGYIESFGKGHINVNMFNGKTWKANHLVEVM